MVKAVVQTGPAPSVVVQAAQSDSKRTDHLGLELVRGVYLKELFQAHFPPVDYDVTRCYVTHYNFTFALDTLRALKDQEGHLDPELSD